MNIRATIDIETENSEILKEILIREPNIIAETDLLKINLSTESVSGLRSAVNSYINWIIESENLMETE